MKEMQRAFIPGSKWIYFKLYTGYKISDIVLSEKIFVIINNLKRKNLIDKWFFIRYTDPEHHIRIRLLMRDESCIGNIINLFYKNLHPFSENNLIWKIQIDTYNRELERYGNTLIKEAESIFCIDSEYSLYTIRKLNKMKNENYRWMIALKMIDSFLSDFSLEITQKQQLMKNVSDSFKVEFGFNQYNSKQFNVKFREHKSTLEAVLNNAITDKEYLCLVEFIKNKSRKLLPVIAQIREKLKKQKNIPLDSLLLSYIHMMLNRHFRSKNRLHELILYDFMYRYYTSEIAKQNYSSKPLQNSDFIPIFSPHSTN